jgi:DNA-directed RNA polymerase subunit K/omega
MVASPAIEPAPVEATSSHHGPLTGFLLASVAFQRAKQLQGGARPHVDAGDHKPTRVALLEILADTISWTTEAEPDGPAGTATRR